MAGTVLYDGIISGAAMAAAMNVSGGDILPIVSANGQRVLLLA